MAPSIPSMLRSPAALLGAGLALAWSTDASTSMLDLSLEAVDFTPYPGYSGDLAITGKFAVVGSADGKQIITFAFDGVDPNCSVVPEGVNNACGVHIHEGSECATAGGHLYDTTLATDPWLAVTYVADEDDMTFVEGVEVHDGLSLADLENRTVVVHDVTGGRVACAPLTVVQVIEGATLVASELQAYPEYNGDLDVTGSASIYQVGSGGDAGQVVVFSFSGVDPDCAQWNLSHIPNACGVHVHAGTSCADASEVGGHYYDANTQSVDPWKFIRYVSEGAETQGATEVVVTGFENLDISGHTLVVHDATGSRVACAIVEAEGGKRTTSSHAPMVRFGRLLVPASAMLAYSAVL